MSNDLPMPTDALAIIGSPAAYAEIDRNGRAKNLSYHLIKGVCETPLFLMPDKSISASDLWRERHDARRYRTLKDGFDGFRDKLSEVSEYEWDKILDDACGIK